MSGDNEVNPLIIGNATLYLGDAYELAPVIGPVPVLCIDPNYDFNTSGGGKFRKARTGMEKIEEKGLNKGFNPDILRPDLYNSIVTFCHNDQLHKILPILAARYGRHVLCGWSKTNPIPMANKHYMPDFEPYIHAWNKGGHPVGDLSDLRRIFEHKNGKNNFNHPTVKPDALMDKIMRNVNGDTVLDCFMGTGSTGIAALKAGKRFIGVERDPDYFNIAVTRILGYYGTVI